MKVVHLATTLAGGAGIGLWRYHCALRQAGVDSRVLVMHLPAAPPAEVQRVAWRSRPLPLRVARRLGLYRPQLERLQAEVDALGRHGAAYELYTLPRSNYAPEEHPWVAEATVINLHWVAGLLDWPRFFRRVRQPVVLTLHDQQAYLGGFHYADDAVACPHFADLEARLRALKQRALAGHRVSVLANSRWNARAAEASGFFPVGTPLSTIYYPLDVALYAPRPRAEAKALCNLDPARRVIGFASENLNNRRKGFADLLAALALLPAELRAQVTLLSFGRDPSPDLRARVELPWQHRGFLEGDEAKAATYAAMDVFVVPSRAEAFGLTAIEAQACGVPVLANPVGGLSEAVSYAREDFAAGAATPAKLAEALAALLSSPARGLARAARGRAEVVERHDPIRTGTSLAEFHHQACA